MKLKSSPLVRLKPKGSRPPFIFAPPLAGTANIYKELARCLPEDQPFYVLMSPGLAGECAPIDRLTLMCELFVQAIKEVQPNGPYILGGWSMGGTLAIEMAQQLTKAGDHVALAVLLDSEVAGAERKDVPEVHDELERVRRFSGIIPDPKGGPIQVDLDKLTTVDDRLSAILKKAQERGVYPPQLGLKQIRNMYQVFSANFLASRNYVASPYAGPVAIVSSDAWKVWQKGRFQEDLTLGWGPLLSDVRGTLRMPVDHRYLMFSLHRAGGRLDLQSRGGCANAGGSPMTLTIAIASTFTAEPLLPSIDFWSKTLGANLSVEFAPYNQVFQELLDPSSLLHRKDNALNVLLVRPEDWQRDQQRLSGGDAARQLERLGDELIQAVRGLAGRSQVPCLLVLPPAAESARGPASAEVRARIASELAAVNGVYLVPDAELTAAAPAGDPFDALADAKAHIPYTDVYFAALGTRVVRKVAALRRPPFKVIALDCDNTLWDGVVGEEGVAGIKLTEARLALQRFMISQGDAGMLLCLVSKNNPDDVWEVFDRREDMPLRKNHVTAARINWLPKSQNLRDLAQQLSLGLDSFIFIDDSKLECAEVQASCPEVLTLLLPSDPAEIPEFLQSVWAFDHLKVTEEDKARTSMYRQVVQREALRKESLSFSDFVADLQLQVSVRPLAAEQVARVAQLTQRTNQFNCSTARKVDSQIQALLQSPEPACFVTEVSDRFGDYGLVGVVIVEPAAESLVVETLLLSCRALGRGVEHRLVAKLGELAQERRLAYVDLLYRPTAKNEPARNFLEQLKAVREAKGDGARYRLLAAEAAQLRFDPGASAAPAEDGGDAKVAPAPAAVAATASSAFRLGSALTQDVFARLRTAERVFAAMEGLDPPVRDAGDSSPKELLLSIWRRVLKQPNIGENDDFFGLGGDSLQAMRVSLEATRRGLKVSSELFVLHPTVAQLAAACQAVQSPATKQAAAAFELEPAFLEQLRQRYPHFQEALPCSVPQKHMLSFCNPQSETSRHFLVQIAGTLEGELDVAGFKRAWQLAADRNAALRTAFAWKGRTEAVQVVSQKAPLSWHEEDWSALSAEDLGDRFERFLEQDRQREFSYAKAPLARHALFRTGANEHRFVFTYWHPVIDGWSCTLLFNDVAALYQAERKGAPAPSARPSYASYVAYSRAQPRSKDEPYWRAGLKGFIRPNSIVPEPNRPGLFGDTTAARLEQPIPDAELEALRRWAKAERLSLNTVLQALWALLIHRRTRDADVVYFNTVSGRRIPLEAPGELVGCMVHFTAVRTSLAPEATLRSFVAELHQQLAQHGEHEVTSPVEITTWSDIPKQRLAQSTWNYHRGEDEWLDGSEDLPFRLRGVRTLSRSDVFPLRMDVYSGARVVLSLSYRTSYLDALEAKRILSEYLEVVRALHSARSDTPLSQWLVAQRP